MELVSGNDVYNNLITAINSNKDRPKLLKSILNYVESVNFTAFSKRGLTIDIPKQETRFKKHEIKLTETEFNLLKFFMQNENRILTVEEISTNVWGSECYSNTNVVAVYVNYLRNKIDKKFGVKFIHTIGKSGYLFK
nr:winged helix-turn-helix domain-containing protein [Clostridioides sp.]